MMEIGMILGFCGVAVLLAIPSERRAPTWAVILAAVLALSALAFVVAA